MKILRIARWSAIVLLIGSAYMNIVKPISAGSLLVISDTTQAGFAIFAAAATLVAGAKFSIENPFRKIWISIGIGLSLWAVGEILWWLLEAVMGIDPYPSIADLFWSAGYIPLFGGIIYAYRRLGAKPTPVSIALSVLLVVVMMIDYFTFLFLPILKSDIGGIEKAVDLGYPIGDSILMIPIVFTLLTAKFKTVSTPWKWMLLGFALVFVADSLFVYMTFNKSFSPGGLLDLAWMTGYFIFGMISLHQIEIILRKGNEFATKSYEKAA